MTYPRKLFRDRSIGTEISVSADDLNGTPQAARFGQRIGRLIDRNVRSNQSRITLDLGNVDRISSAGLNELIAVNRLARGKGQQIVLLDVPETVREVFVVTRLERLFQFASRSLDG